MNNSDFLRLSKKYIWWKKPEESLVDKQRILAQIMDLGTEEDTRFLLENNKSEDLCFVLRNAQPGWFRPKSWTFWHYVLDIAEHEKDIPPLPSRNFSH